MGEGVSVKEGGERHQVIADRKRQPQISGTVRQRVQEWGGGSCQNEHAQRSLGGRKDPRVCTGHYHGGDNTEPLAKTKPRRHERDSRKREYHTVKDVRPDPQHETQSPLVRLKRLQWQRLHPSFTATVVARTHTPTTREFEKKKKSCIQPFTLGPDLSLALYRQVANWAAHVPQVGRTESHLVFRAVQTSHAFRGFAFCDVKERRARGGARGLGGLKRVMISQK